MLLLFYRSEKLVPLDTFKALFIKFPTATTTLVEFSFNNTSYKQVDVVAMGSPLGPALANIIVGYHRKDLF